MELEWQCDVEGCTGPYYKIGKNMMVAGNKLSTENKIFLAQLHRKKYCLESTNAQTAKKPTREAFWKMKKCAFCRKKAVTKVMIVVEEKTLSFCGAKCMLANNEVGSALKKPSGEDPTLEHADERQEKRDGARRTLFEDDRVTAGTAKTLLAIEDKKGEDESESKYRPISEQEWKKIAAGEVLWRDVDRDGERRGRCLRCGNKMVKGQFHDEEAPGGADWQCGTCGMEKGRSNESQIDEAEKNLENTMILWDDALSMGDKWAAGKFKEDAMKDGMMLMIARGNEEESERIMKKMKEEEDYEDAKNDMVQKEVTKEAEETAMTLVYWGPERSEQQNGQMHYGPKMKRCKKCDGMKFRFPAEPKAEWLRTWCDSDEGVEMRRDEERRAAAEAIQEQHTNEQGAKHEKDKMIEVDQEEIAKDEVEQKEAMEWDAKELEEEEDNWIAELAGFVGNPLRWDHYEEIREALRARELYYENFRKEAECLESQQ